MVHKVSGAGGCVGKSCKQHGQRHKPPKSSTVNVITIQKQRITGAEGDFNGCKSGLKDKGGHSKLGRGFDFEPHLQNL